MHGSSLPSRFVVVDIRRCSNRSPFDHCLRSFFLGLVPCWETVRPVICGGVWCSGYELAQVGGCCCFRLELVAVMTSLLCEGLNSSQLIE